MYKPGSYFQRPWPDAYEKYVASLVRIGPSKIPGAGLGAFAKQDLPKDFYLGPYRGIVIAEDVYDAMSDEDSGYVVSIVRPDGSNIRVDASSTEPRKSNWTRYMNDPYNTNLTVNVELDAAGNFFTLCDIKAGCELFWSYGAQYWPDEDVLEILPIESAQTCNCGPE